MGVTHFRSDVKEEGTRTLAFTNASIVSGTFGTCTADQHVGTNYLKLGTVYLISGVPAGVTTADISAIATPLIGVSVTASIPKGSLFLNASSGATATLFLYVMNNAASWCIVTTGSAV